MGKDVKLINIYIKIHNRKVLTMDDLAYLAKYNPECYKKTCENLIYKMPETKPLVQPAQETSKLAKNPAAAEPARNPFEATAEDKLQNEQMIMQFFESMKRIEANETSTVQNVDVDHVKELVGSLFMESLFPHNDLPGYFDTDQEDSSSTFNVRV